MNDTRIVDFIVKYKPRIEYDEFTHPDMRVWRMRWRDPWRLEPLAIGHTDFRRGALMAAEEMDRRDPSKVPSTVEGMRALVNDLLSSEAPPQ